MSPTNSTLTQKLYYTGKIPREVVGPEVTAPHLHIGDRRYRLNMRTGKLISIGRR